MKPSELRQGDVLFYNSNGFVSRAIRFFDHGIHNHVAFWTGDTVAEAVGDGFIERSLNDSIVPTVNFVDVYRPYIGARTLNEKEVTELVRVCDDYLDDGDRYAYEALVLCAITCELRQIVPYRGFVDRIVNFAMKRLISYAKAIDILDSFLEQGKEPMICSEAVYRIFNDARMPLKLLPESLHNIYTGRDSSLVVGAKLKERQLLSEVEPNFVTPHDLAMSPSLRFIGRLEYKHLITEFK